MGKSDKTPEHLGGHNNKTWIDEGALKYLMNQYQVKSMLDIGCGPGDQIQVAKSLGLFAYGIDGDPLFKDNPDIQIHDFTVGPAKIDKVPEQGYYDLGWSVEFLEHVEAQYIPSYMAAFESCKYVIVTHATPGQGGYHHVNEQHFSYWQDVFSQHGFKASANMTKGIRENSSMRRKMVEHIITFNGDDVICSTNKKSFLEKNGWGFINQKLVSA